MLKERGLRVSGRRLKGGGEHVVARFKIYFVVIVIDTQVIYVVIEITSPDVISLTHALSPAGSAALISTPIAQCTAST